MNAEQQLKAVPMPRQQIQLVDANDEVQAVTFVAELVSYSMNGCYKVRDRNGVLRVVTRTRDTMTTTWKSVTLHS